MNFDKAVAIISIDDLMDICNNNSHGFVIFALTAGLIGSGIAIRSLMKRVDKLEEQIVELVAEKGMEFEELSEAINIPDDLDLD